MKYIKKPIPVEAFCPKYDAWPEWFLDSGYKIIHSDKDNVIIGIPTLEGLMTCSEEDYIIRGIKGEIYPCKRDIFLETYEESN